MNDRLQELRGFVRAAESGSFSRAAAELGLTRPSVSRIVSELETRLEAKLLLRITLQITLTDAGGVFLERARQILADLGEAEHAARGVDSLQGMVRLAMPMLYGAARIIPFLPALLERHPGLRMHLTIDDSYQDLIADGVNIAIRAGKLADSGMGARRIDTLHRYIVAAPSYLAKRGTPRTPADLAEHDCISGAGSLGPESWMFAKDATITSVNIQGRVQTYSTPGALSLAIAGLGIAVSSNVAAGEALKIGSLARLLQDYELPPIEVHAVFPQGPRPSPKVRAVVDFLEDCLREHAP
ncbi:MAG: LysR family transcriptional regulator [Candidatus Protistobacter heckmanni]|nr:LysR family transcriptional regulator [Candidatus Protistobacter heckmanni]